MALVLALAFCSQTLAQSNFIDQKYTISAPGINASFINYGATLTNLFVNDRDGVPRDIVLGYDEPTAYIKDTETVHTYFGTSYPPSF